MFLYREKEISLLKEDFNKPRSSMNFIFGRRRVGKTSLINEYVRNKQTLHLVCFETMSSLLIKEFQKNINTFFNIDETINTKTFEELFAYLSEMKIDSKTIIVFENIQELIKIDKDFLINLNNYWNKYLSKMNIQLIITSSLLPNDFDNLLISKKVDNKIKLKSLSFNVIKEYFPNLDKNETMYLFTAFGTNPEYLKLYDVKKDFISNIKNTCLSFDASLYNEGMNIIKKDLGEAATYCSILYAISIGNNKIGDIADCLNLKSSYLTRYMQKLLDLMLINKVVPLTQTANKSKFGRYEIEDNFLKFWFCYVYTNINSINSNNINKVISHIEQDFSKRLVSSAYKKYFYELLEDKNSQFFNYEPIKIGSWWNNKDIEFDFVAYDSKTITFIDCKWDKNEGIENDYKKLEIKAQEFDTQLERKYEIF